MLYLGSDQTLNSMLHNIKNEVGVCFDDGGEKLEETDCELEYSEYIINVLGLNSGINLLSGYSCSVGIQLHDLPIRATLRDKSQSELRGMIKANQRGTQ